MPEFMTLGEAARTLGISEEELKRLAQERRVRSFMDAGSMQFRKTDIEEEARRRGMGSDPELPLSDLDLETASPSDGLDLSEFQLGVAAPDLAPPSLDLPAIDEGSEHEILLDDRSLPTNAPTGSSSTIIGMHPGKGKSPSDSDVRIMPESPGRSASDSDVRMGSTTSGRPSDSDVTLADEGPSSHDVRDLPGAGKKPAPKPAPVPEPADDPNATMLQPSPILDASDDEIVVGESTSDSDFELTPSGVIDMLEPESGSDFELSALDGSDEFESTPMRGGLSDSDVTGAQPIDSGINLSRPSDSGINLQNVGGFDMASADSIELAPLDEDADQPGKPAPKPSKPAAKPKAAEKVDLSATALPVRADKDIFEDTDFDVDVDAIDSSDEDRTVQLDAQSDFDVEEGSGDSASEVFAVDEEDVDANAATAMGPAVAPADDDDVSGETDSAWDVEEVTTPSSASRAVPSPLVTAGGPTPEWGGLWVGLLGVATLLMLFLAFVGIDLVRNLYNFQGDTPASGLIQQLAGLLGR